MKEQKEQNQEKRPNARKKALVFAAVLAIAASVIALAPYLLPLSQSPTRHGQGLAQPDSGLAESNLSSGETEELFRHSKSDGTFRFSGMSDGWIYYEIDEGYDEPNTLWRMKKDGTGRARIAEDSKGFFDYTGFKTSQGRIYYTAGSQIRSTKPDLSDAFTVSKRANSYFSDLDTAGPWLYFVRSDYPASRRYYDPPVTGLYRMKLDGRHAEQIAQADEYTSFQCLVATDQQLFYLIFSEWEAGMKIASRNVQGGEETILESGIYEDLDYLCYSNGFLYYSRFSPSKNERHLCSLDTRVPNSEKVLLSAKNSMSQEVFFYVPFVENDWVYYTKTKKKYSQKTSAVTFTDELRRVRTDGSGDELILDNDSFERILGYDGDCIFYQAYDKKSRETVVCRMKTP